MKKMFFVFLILFLFTSCTKSTRTLHIYSWCDYFSEEIIEKFENEYNCDIIIDVFDSNEMLFAKMQSGAASYDIIVPSHYFVSKMSSLGILYKIDPIFLPNVFSYLDHEVFRGFSNEINDYAVPYLIGYTGIGYRKSADVSCKSWSLLENADFKDRMTLLDDPNEVIGSAAKYLGYDAKRIISDDEAMENVVKVARSWRENAAKFDNEMYKNGLAAGEFKIAMGYSSDLGQLSYSDESCGFFVPEEGCFMSCDMLAIPINSPNKGLALEFINMLYEQQNAARTIMDIHAYCPCKGVRRYLDEKTSADQSIFVPDEIVEKSEFMPDLNLEQERRMLKYWEKIRH